MRAAEVRFSKTEQRPVAWLRARGKKEEPRCASLHEREGMDAGIGAKATVLDCMGGDGEGQARPGAMAKARHLPVLEGNCAWPGGDGGLGAMAKATAHRGSVTWRIASGRREREGMDAGIGAKGNGLGLHGGDGEGNCASLQA